MFEWESELAQVVTGVRRYVDMNDDRLYGLATGELNDLLKCVNRIYGTDVEYLLLDEIQDVEWWYIDGLAIKIVNAAEWFISYRV